MTPRLSAFTRRLRREEGATLIWVAVSLTALAGISAIVVDYGVFWLSRGQAQNAADGGALAGAVALAFDEPDSAGEPGGRAETAAIAVASGNPVFPGDGGTSGVVVQFTCPPWVAGGGCVQVDVHRDGEAGSTTLPVYFAPLFGAASQQIKATATAQAIPANASECLRPWAAPDRWEDNRLPATEFNRYQTSGPDRGQLLPGLVDEYMPPVGGTGFGVPSDFGVQVILHFGNPSGSDPITNGWYLSVDIPRADGTPASGGARYRANIESCNNVAAEIGDYLALESGAKVGPTVQGVQALIDQDPGAYWAGDGIAGSCVNNDPPCASQSPRVVAIALYDPDDYQLRQALNDTSDCPGGGQCVLVRNILGFFVEGFVGNDVMGRIVKTSGVRTEGGWDVVDPSAFLWEIRLIR